MIDRFSRETNEVSVKAEFLNKNVFICSKMDHWGRQHSLTRYFKILHIFDTVGHAKFCDFVRENYPGEHSDIDEQSDEEVRAQYKLALFTWNDFKLDLYNLGQQNWDAFKYPDPKHRGAADLRKAIKVGIFKADRTPIQEFLNSKPAVKNNIGPEMKHDSESPPAGDGDSASSSAADVVTSWSRAAGRNNFSQDQLLTVMTTASATACATAVNHHIKPVTSALQEATANVRNFVDLNVRIENLVTRLGALESYLKDARDQGKITLPSDIVAEIERHERSAVFQELLNKTARKEITSQFNTQCKGINQTLESAEMASAIALNSKKALENVEKKMDKTMVTHDSLASSLVAYGAADAAQKIEIAEQAKEIENLKERLNRTDKFIHVLGENFLKMSNLIEVAETTPNEINVVDICGTLKSEFKLQAQGCAEHLNLVCDSDKFIKPQIVEVKGTKDGENTK